MSNVQIYSTGVFAKPANGIKCLIYGGSGVGKTRLAATLERCLILSAENGLLSLRKDNLPFVPIRNFSEAEKYYNWLLENKGDARHFQSIAIDSASEIAEDILSDEKKKNKDPRKAYGETQDKIIQMLRAYRDLPGRNVYFIAKQEWIKDEATGAMIFGPSFPGNKLAQAVPYFFDEVFQLVAWEDQATKQTHRALKCRKDQYSEGKDRSGALDLWEPPNLTHVFNKILSS